MSGSIVVGRPRVGRNGLKPAWLACFRKTQRMTHKGNIEIEQTLVNVLGATIKHLRLGLWCIRESSTEDARFRVGRNCQMYQPSRAFPQTLVTCPIPGVTTHVY